MIIPQLTCTAVTIGLLVTSAFAQAPKKKGISVGEPPADHSPEAELASFKILEGFNVNLFASELDGVPNPLVIRWDERGRLWVISTTAYPQPAPGEPNNDKLLILEDTDHDGKADKITTFADGLRMPMGMELAGPGEVYVGEGEKLWLFKDTDHDDRVDVKEEVFSGFGTGDTHQNLNSFIWAPDGALVMHQGLHCYSRVTTPWGVKQLYGCGFWRFWPRSKKLEAYPTGMPQNAWGTAFDRWGQPIMVAGAAGMYWSRPMEISVPEIQTENAQPYFLLTRFMLPSSGQIIKTDGLRKFCGVDIPWNDHWPNAMADEIVSGGFFDNAVFRYRMDEDAQNPSGFQAIEQEPLITSDNVAFRPVDIRFGPEGALYVADWYDPIIGHYQASFRHPNRDKSHGRIWRVWYGGRTNGKPSSDAPDPFAGMGRSLINWQKRNGDTAGTATERLLDMMTNHSDRWTRYQAQRLFMHRPKSEALAAAKAMWNACSHKKGSAPSWTDDEPNERHRKNAAIQAFEMFEEPSADLISTAVQESNSLVRAYSVHALGNWADRLPDALKLLDSRIDDDVPRVRLEAIVACAKLQQPDAIKVALKALDKSMDSFLDRALWLTVHATAPQWKSRIVSSAGGTEFLNSLPAHHLAYLIEKEGSAGLLDAVRQMVTEKATTLAPETLRGLISALAKTGAPDDLLNALKLGQRDTVLLNEVARTAAEKGGKAPAGAEEILSQLLETGTPEQRMAACRISGAWHMKNLSRSILQLTKSDENLRAVALAALGKLGAAPDTFAVIVINPKETWPIRIAALSALADVQPTHTGSLAAKALSSIPDPETMRAWLTPLLSREALITALAKAVESEPCTPEAAKIALATLTAAGRSDAPLTAAFGKILGVKNIVPAYDPAWVNALAAEVKSTGNPSAGKAVFNAPLSSCTACHQINKQGGIIGPELDTVGRGVPVELLIEAVVWPNRQIKEGYVATTLSLKDGRKLQGYKISEANGELQLRDLLTGAISRIPNSQIKDRQEAGTLMPEGLIMNMTRADLCNLIAYLASLGK